MAAIMDWSCLWACVLLSMIMVLVQECSALNKYYMDQRCSGVLDLTQKNIQSGKLSLTARSHYRPRMNCRMIIRAPRNFQIAVRFLDIDIKRLFTCDDWVQLYDGDSSTDRPLTSRICGESKPRTVYRSNGRDLTVRFVSDYFRNDDGFKLLFTAFHTGPCKGGELKCKNGYCVSNSLKCDGYDNCGDRSDECGLSTGATIGIVFSLVVVVAIVVAIVTYCCRKRRSRGRVIKTNQPTAVPLASMTTTNVPVAYPTAPQPAYPVVPQPGYPMQPQPGYGPPPAYPYGQPGGIPPSQQGYPYGQPGGYPQQPPPPGYPPAYAEKPPM